MATVELPIANGFYRSLSLPVSAQDCINFYPVIPEAPALTQGALFSTPGLDQLATSGDVKQANRGAHNKAGVPYFVNGDGLYRLNQTIDGEGAETFDLELLGKIEGEGAVSIADNGTQMLVLVPGGKGYIWNEDDGTPFQEITDPDFLANGNPQYVVYIDGFFVVTTDTKKFIVSAINDGLNWNALDFGSAEADPDPIVAPIVFKNQLFIGGTQTIEAFQNVGGVDFPFVRTGLMIQKGIFSANSIINGSNTFAFLGAGIREAASIYAFAGNDVQKISTDAIDSILHNQSIDDLRSMTSWTYALDGAFFIGFRLPSTTLVFDTTAGRWHERKSQITDELNVTSITGLRITRVIAGYGRLLVGDAVDGRVGSLLEETQTEYGRNIIRRFTTQPFFNNNKSISVPELEMTLESGIEPVIGNNPQVRMARSKDGGRTFNDERQRSMGKTGEYNRRAIWRRNGRVGRFECFRFSVSDPVRHAMITMTANIQSGVI